MPPLVSIIIPSYNTARFLPEALETIFVQSYKYYEIIVVDDGSSDETAAILEPYLSRIQYIYQSNQGVSAARNHGLAKAQGEWVLFLDADDKLSPSKLEQQLAVAGQDTAILHSGWWLIDEDGELISEAKPYLTVPKLNLQSWLLWKPVFPAAMLFRRSWLEKVGGFDTSLAHAEDVDLVLRIAAEGGESLWLKGATAYYRQREGSASTKTLQQAQSIERVLDKLFANPSLPLSVREIEGNVRYYSTLWYCWRLLDEGYFEEAKANLLRVKALRNRSDEFLLLEWQEQYAGDANEFFMNCLHVEGAKAILANDFTQFSPRQQVSLLYAYISTRKNLPEQLNTIVAGLSPAGKLAAFLSLAAKSTKRKDWRSFLKTLPQIFRWSWSFDAPYVYFVVLRQIRYEI